jgi:hypothetical protein
MMETKNSVEFARKRKIGKPVMVISKVLMYVITIIILVVIGIASISAMYYYTMF